MKPWQVLPSNGVDQLRFGMTPEQVERSYGPPAKVRTTRLNEREEVRNDWFARYAQGSGRLIELSFLPTHPLMLGDIHIFSDANAFERLLELDGSPSEYLGFIVLFSIGLALTGFHDKDQAQKAVTVFPRGRWDDLRPRMQLFEMQ